MNSPMLVLGATLLLAVLVVALRREAVAAWLATSLGTGVVAAVVFLARPDSALLPLGGTWVLLGRSLELGDANRAIVGFVYLVAGFMFLGARVARPGRLFYAAGLLVTGLAAASLMAVPFLYAALFLEGMALVAVLML